MEKLNKIPQKGFPYKNINEIIDNVNEVGKSLANLNTIEREITSGKEKIALAITEKGVPTDSEMSFNEMAKNVELINQITINFDADAYSEIMAPSDLVYDIIKAGLDNVRGDYSTLMVGEFYKGAYESISLSGADAYFTSDGHFYDHNTTHVWDEDSHINRYVIYYYAEDGADFNVVDGLCPHKVFVIGHLGAFICATEGRVTTFYKSNGSTIKDIRFLAGNVWQETVVVDIEEHSSGVIVKNNNYIKNTFIACKSVSNTIIESTETLAIDELYVFVEELKSGSIILYANVSGNGSVKMPYNIVLEILKMNGGEMFVKNGNTNYAFNGDSSIVVKKLKSFDGGTIFGGGVCSNKNKVKLSLPDLETINGGHIIEADIVEIDVLELPNLENINSGAILYNNVYGTHVYSVYAPKLKSSVNYGIVYGLSRDLFDVTVGEMETNLHMSSWNPTNILQDSTKKVQLNANIRNHIAAKVSDRTGQTALTFTVSTNLYNNLEQETINAFTAKNWNVAGA